jgi:hypothetical protein
MGDQALTGVQPSVWYLVFERRVKRRWVKWLSAGRHVHVSALGRLPDQKLWVHYDVCFGATRISVWPDCDDVDGFIEELTRETTVVVMQPGFVAGMKLRFGFWCVPAMAHLVGVREIVLRPDALLKACLRKGGAVV